MAARKVYLVYDRRNEAPVKGDGKYELCINLGDHHQKYMKLGRCTPEALPNMCNRRDVILEMEKALQVLATIEELGEELNLKNYNFHAGLKDGNRKSEKQRLEEEKHVNFCDWMRACLEKVDLKPATQKRKLRAVSALEKSGFIRKISDITIPNIYRYDEYLHLPYKFKTGDHVRIIQRDQATIYGYHKVIHQYVTCAWKFGLIPVDPYNLIKLDHGEYKKRTPLTEEEIQRLCDLKDLNPSMVISRDLFLFACYTGLSYLDTQIFKFEYVVEEDGMHFIDANRGKTGKPFYAPILAPAWEILCRYNFQLPKMSNQKLNGYLKIMQDMAQISKNITFHVARHTFATMVLSYDVPLEKVSRMLGHTNVRTTAIYAKVTNSTIEKHSRELAEKIKPMALVLPSTEDEPKTPQTSIIVEDGFEDSRNLREATYFKDGQCISEDTPMEELEKTSVQPQEEHKSKRRRRRHHRVLDSSKDLQYGTPIVEGNNSSAANDANTSFSSGSSFGFNITGYYTTW